MSVVAVQQCGPGRSIAIDRREKLNAINRAVAVELRVVAPGNEIDEAAALAKKIVDLAPLAPLAPAAMERFVNGGVLPKGPAELAGRYGAELAAVRDSDDAREGGRDVPGKAAAALSGAIARGRRDQAAMNSGMAFDFSIRAASLASL